MVFPNLLTPFKLLEVFPIERNSVALTSLTPTDYGSNSAFNPSVGREIKACLMTSLRPIVIGRAGKTMFRT